ncbi:MAG: TonB-dependent receptor plug domain-containing protein, partial [Hyphomicrobium sp.]
IETKAATKPGFSMSGGVEGGEYGTFNGAAMVGYAATDGSNISLTVQGVDTNGFSAASSGIEDDGYRNLTISGRGEYILSPAAKLFFAARTLDADGDFDGFDPVSFLPADAPMTLETVQHAGRTGIDISLFDGAFQSTFAIQGTKISRDEFNTGVRTSWFEGDRVKGEYKGVLRFNDSLSLLAGADWEETGMENLLVSRATADISGAYAQLMAEPIDGLVLTGGARRDDHSTFGEFDTYRLTAAYLVPGTDTKLRASRGTGFRTPSLDELFGVYDFGLGPFDYGNPDLQPEESTSWDAGIEQGFWSGRLKLGATYFEIDTDNLIVFDFGCGFGAPVCNFNQPGVTQRNGVELSAAAIVPEGLTVTAGYTYTDTETADGERLTYVPRHNFVVGFDAQPIDKVDLNVTVKYLADSIHSVGPPAVELDDYVLVSAKASYEVIPGWKAYVRGENLLDEDYETILGYGTAGLSVYGGLSMVLPND